MSKTILLTGVTGYLGSHLAKVLLANGYDIVALKRTTSSLRRIESLLPDIALYDLEGLDLAIPFEAHGKIDAVIHTATCYGRNGELVSEIIESNIMFPVRLLETAAFFDTPVFIN